MSEPIRPAMLFITGLFGTKISEAKILVYVNADAGLILYEDPIARIVRQIFVYFVAGYDHTRENR